LADFFFNSDSHELEYTLSCRNSGWLRMTGFKQITEKALYNDNNDPHHVPTTTRFLAKWVLHQIK